MSRQKLLFATVEKDHGDAVFPVDKEVVETVLLKKNVGPNAPSVKYFSGKVIHNF